MKPLSTVKDQLKLTASHENNCLWYFIICCVLIEALPLIKTLAWQLRWYCDKFTITLTVNMTLTHKKMTRTIKCYWQDNTNDSDSTDKDSDSIKDKDNDKSITNMSRTMAVAWTYNCHWHWKNGNMGNDTYMAVTVNDKDNDKVRNNDNTNDNDIDYLLEATPVEYARVGEYGEWLFSHNTAYFFDMALCWFLGKVW